MESPPSTVTQLLLDRQLEDLERLGGVEGLSRKLNTDRENGLDETEEEMQKRRDVFGANTYPNKVTMGFWSFVWDARKDTSLIILLVCAVIAFAAGIWTKGLENGWQEGTSIGFAGILTIIVTAVSNYKQELTFQTLNEEKEGIHLDVLRAGRRESVSISEIVVGDIVGLSIGGQVPADGVLVEGHSLRIDEAIISGESFPVEKDKVRPFLLSGCKVQDGQGTMLVTGVGLNTEWGKSKASTYVRNDENTPLQDRLESASELLLGIGISFAVVLFVILTCWYFATTFKQASAMDRRVGQVIKDLVRIFLITVTIVVVLIPEGLSLAVTLTLAYCLQKMVADKALVRNLVACETMGSATTICCDKTGTLTTNKMTVEEACLAGEMKSKRDALDGVEALPANLRTLLIDSVCLNSDGNVSPAKPGEEPVMSGSPTEAAILTWGLKLGMDFRAIRREKKVLHVETFNSEKRRGGVVYKNVDGEVQMHWKGAAETILDLCTMWMDSNGECQPMTSAKREEFNSVNEGMAAKALRCIAFAYRSIEESEIPSSKEARSAWQALDQGLVLMAIAGIKDPCRARVREAVDDCRRAGVKVRMVTGDNICTAKAVATDCGILTEGGQVVEGKEFRTWDDAKQESSLDNLVVMARSLPSDKVKLVKALKQRGEVVAVTGDGTNDAPALANSDIGLSMGIAGTEVAKESSDIIILDDNFTTVVKVMRWGRSVYANIQKFVQFQITLNVVLLVINFVGAVSSGEVPLTTVQLLWVNLIMNTMGALALATEAPTDDLMDKTAIGREEPLITNIMWRNIVGQAIYQIFFVLFLTHRGIELLGLKGTRDEQVLQRDNIIFNAFVFCQLFNQINARRPESFNVFQGILKDYLFLAIIVISMCFQVIIVTVANNFEDMTWSQIKWFQLLVDLGLVVLPLLVLILFLSISFPCCQAQCSGLGTGLGKYCSLPLLVSGTVAFEVVVALCLNNFAPATKLQIKWWGLCVVIGSVALPLDALIKCVPVPAKPFLEMSCFPKWASLWRKVCTRLHSSESGKELSATTGFGSSRRTDGSKRRISNA